MEKQKSIFGPLLLIAVGAVWLLVKAGTLPSANLWALTYIWPYLLIAAGLGLILRPYFKYTNLLLDVLIIGGALFAIFNAPALGWAKPSMVYVLGNNDFYVGPAEPGSGKVITQNRSVDDFDGIEVSYPAEVTITQGKTPAVKVEGEDNVLSGLRTEVRGDTLRIYYKVDEGNPVNATELVKITIVVKDLQAVDFESAGELTLTGIETDELRVSVSGAGNLELNNIAVQNLQVDLSGAGNMAASGTADDLRVTISGFGSFDGEALHSQTADISMSGAGSATAWVDKKLNAEISGAGSITYYGEASVTKEIGGLGNVSHAGNK
jgi:hypothetical protein